MVTIVMCNKAFLRSINYTEGERPNMKKALAVLSISAVALTLTVTPAFAKGGGNGGWFGGFFSRIFARFEPGNNASTFVITGNVASTSSNSVTVKVISSVHVPNLNSGQATVNVASNTKFVGQKNTTINLSNIAVNDRVSITGLVSGSTLTATTIRDLGLPPVMPNASSGKVTAVSSSSITLSNALSGQTQTFNIASNARVTIDGQVKTVGDIQSGDAGSIRSKNVSGTFTAQLINLFR
jgi:hypothetical protein